MMKLALALVALFAVGSSAVLPPAGSVGCQFCKVGFSTLEYMLSMNQTEEAIEWVLGQICNLMPDPEKTACHKVILADIKELIAMVKSVESPEEICCQIGACDSPCPVVDPPCSICKYLITDIERWLEEGKGKEEIAELIDQWCKLLPTSAQPVCQKITDIGIETLIDMIVRYEDPKTVCEQITLCNKTAKPKIAAAIEEAMLNEPAGCTWCKIGFGFLEQIIELNESEYWIEWALTYVCTLLPEPQKTACHDVVDSDLKEIIALLKNVESPEEICCQVGACDKPCPIVDVPCSICKFLMTDLDHWLRQGKGEEEIEHLLDAWCLLLPSGTGICEKITDIGVKALIDMILKYENPSLVCFEIELCNTTSH